jgi:hypothetical protein
VSNDLVGAGIELDDGIGAGNERPLPGPETAADDEETAIAQGRHAKVAACPQQGRQRLSSGQVIGGADDAGELLKLLDEIGVGRRAPAGAADREEQAIVVDESLAAEDVAGIQLEVVDLIADRAPVEDALIAGRVEEFAVEGAVERDGLPRAGVEHPGDVVAAAVGMQPPQLAFDILPLGPRPL